MKTITCALLLLTSGAAASSVFGAESIVSGHDLAAVGTNMIDVGSIFCDKPVSVPFRLRNVSTNTIKLFTITPTCSCIRGQSDKRELAPDEVAVIQVTLDPSAIRGDFHRSVWIKTHAVNMSELLLTVTGRAIPMFVGGPEHPVAFFADTPGVTQTNRFTLTATKAGLSLGKPSFSTNDNIVMDALLTPAASTNASLAAYDVTLMMTPLSNGFHTAMVSFPVVSAEQLPPVRVPVQMRVGAKLNVSPSAVLLHAPSQPHEIRLRLTTEAASCDPKLLTWEPALEGVEVSVAVGAAISRPMLGGKSSKGLRQPRSNFIVTLKLSPQAVQTLLSQNDPELQFHYPSHSPVSVRFVPAGK